MAVHMAERLGLNPTSSPTNLILEALARSSDQLSSRLRGSLG